MATAKKLPSGSWRCQVYDYTNSNGKRVYRSFTASTKKEAEYLAAEYARNKGDLHEELTVKDALTRYVDIKREVLSPSTIRGYMTSVRNHYKDIESINIKKLNSTVLQVWISNLSKQLSSKTVHNAHGLLMSSLEMFLPDVHFKTTMPARTQPDLYTPNDNDVKKLLKSISGTELELAVLLAAFGPMRRGEICALTTDDIKGKRVSVTKSMVRSEQNTWEIKQPKTYSSYRTIEYPDFVIQELLGCNGKIVHLTPDGLSMAFKRALERSGIKHFRFHDLRHYAASIMHAIGVPDQYIMHRGGWKTDIVMKSVYRNVIDMEEVKQNKVINSHFENMQHEMQHEQKKAL